MICLLNKKVISGLSGVRCGTHLVVTPSTGDKNCRATRSFTPSPYLRSHFEWWLTHPGDHCDPNVPLAHAELPMEKSWWFDDLEDSGAHSWVHHFPGTKSLGHTVKGGLRSHVPVASEWAWCLDWVNSLSSPVFMFLWNQSKLQFCLRPGSQSYLQVSQAEHMRVYLIFLFQHCYMFWLFL